MTRNIAILTVCLSVANVAWALTPTPTMTNGACGPGLAASVVAGPTPVVYITGNLNAATPRNPAGGQNFAFPGYVPDASVDFRVYDSVGTPYDLRLSFEQTMSQPSAERAWELTFSDVTGGQLPNAGAWAPGGLGNRIASNSGGTLTFNFTGGLKDNSNNGSDLLLTMPVVNGATSPFYIRVNLGTDASVVPGPGPGEGGLSDGLTGRWCTTDAPTATPTSVPSGNACAMGPYALVTAGPTPVVVLKGNLNACTPMNAAAGAGYAFAGFVPDASADFRVFDTLGTPYDLRISFEQIADTASGQPARWNYTLNDVSDGQTPNATAWTPGGVGNLLEYGGPIDFHADGSLQDNGNGGAPKQLWIPVVNGAGYYFAVNVVFGTDDAAAPNVGVNQRDGLTGDNCCANLPTATDTMTPASTQTACGGCTGTPSATVTPTATPFVASCVAQPTPMCIYPFVYLPVCGCNGVTYTNSSHALCNGITSYTNGACGSGGSATVTLTVTPTLTPIPATATPSQTPTATSTETVIVSFVPTPGSTPNAGGSTTVLPASNPSAPSPSSPLQMFYAVPTGAQVPNAKLMIFSTGNSQIASLPCLVCVGPSLTFSWDGSGVAGGLYYAAVDLGDGVIRGQFPLMILP